MKGVIKGYRGSVKTRDHRNVILHFPEIKHFTKAMHLVGKKVHWQQGKRVFSGRIVARHGDSGKVIARFNTPLPPQAHGKNVVIK